MNTLMRVVFCGVPSLWVFAAGLFAFREMWPVALLPAACLFGLGWKVTKEKHNG